MNEICYMIITKMFLNGRWLIIGMCNKKDQEEGTI